LERRAAKVGRTLVEGRVAPDERRQLPDLRIVLRNVQELRQDAPPQRRRRIGEQQELDVGDGAQRSTPRR
jgi:hypothetical protein